MKDFIIESSSSSSSPSPRRGRSASSSASGAAALGAAASAPPRPHRRRASPTPPAPAASADAQRARERAAPAQRRRASVAACRRGPRAHAARAVCVERGQHADARARALRNAVEVEAEAGGDHVDRGRRPTRARGPGRRPGAAGRACGRGSSPARRPPASATKRPRSTRVRRRRPAPGSANGQHLRQQLAHAPGAELLGAEAQQRRHDRELRQREQAADLERGRERQVFAAVGHDAAQLVGASGRAAAARPSLPPSRARRERHARAAVPGAHRVAAARAVAEADVAGLARPRARRRAAAAARAGRAWPSAARHGAEQADVEVLHQRLEGRAFVGRERPVREHRKAQHLLERIAARSGRRKPMPIVSRTRRLASGSSARQRCLRDLRHGRACVHCVPTAGCAIAPAPSSDVRRPALLAATLANGLHASRPPRRAAARSRFSAAGSGRAADAEPWPMPPITSHVGPARQVGLREHAPVLRQLPARTLGTGGCGGGSAAS